MGDSTLKYLDNLGQELVNAGLISDDQLAVVLETQKNLGGDLGQLLIKKGFLKEDDVFLFLSDRLHIPFISLKDYTIDPDAAKFVPITLAKQYHFMPVFKIDDVLTIAMADPLDVFALDEIRSSLKTRVQPMLASAHEIDHAIYENYRIIDDNDMVGDDVQVIPYGGESSEDVADSLKELASGAKTVAEVNRIISVAAKEKASDIHIEPMENSVKVRSRIDGILEERIILPKHTHVPIVTRIKIMGGMDIAERRVPQDGRVRMKINGRQIDLRISTYPAMYGEKVVMRLLSRDQVYDISSLGFNADERAIFERIISHPHGIFLVTGPTGSGKTTTLYAALQKLNSQANNIVSIEDPIENEIVGVNQAQVNTKAGMTFLSAMRSILRQDPDIIMIGEIRDGETADIAVRAAITGHLVFSTIHTNTALGAVSRLTDLSIEPFMIATSVVGLMSQRLVRRICPHCKIEVSVEENKLISLGLDKNITTYKGSGCKKCRMSGYLGRMGLFQIVEIDDTLRQMILKEESEYKMNNHAREKGFLDMRDKGVLRIREGVTTVDEVLRVTTS